MFRMLQKIWQREDLLKQALETLEVMLNKNKETFQAVTGALIEKKEISFDVYKEDQQINRYETEIRKKILEHLSLSPKQDITFALVLLGATRDVERTGDFCKNIYELSQKKLDGFLGGKYSEVLKNAKEQILEMFDLTYSAFTESDKEKAQKVIDTHRQRIAKELNNMVDEIIDDQEISTRKAVIYVLFSRYLKRISGHLANIASSVTNPFQKVRYVKNGGYIDL